MLLCPDLAAIAATIPAEEGANALVLLCNGLQLAAFLQDVELQKKRANCSSQGHMEIIYCLDKRGIGIIGKNSGSWLRNY